MKLQQFLYLLARDHVPTGMLWAILEECVPGDTVKIYSDEWLEKWSAEFVEQLRGVQIDDLDSIPDAVSKEDCEALPAALQSSDPLNLMNAFFKCPLNVKLPGEYWRKRFAALCEMNVTSRKSIADEVNALRSQIANHIHPRKLKHSVRCAGYRGVDQIFDEDACDCPASLEKSFPWCVKCESYHHVDNPNCSALRQSVDDVHDMHDMLETAWGIIANAWGGDWTQANLDWQRAATRWRDRYHQRLSKLHMSDMVEPEPDLPSLETMTCMTPILKDLATISREGLPDVAKRIEANVDTLLQRAAALERELENERKSDAAEET